MKVAIFSRTLENIYCPFVRPVARFDSFLLWIWSPLWLHHKIQNKNPAQVYFKLSASYVQDSKLFWHSL